jgi:pSer/pThr/pTyr-binding forkhead associated (FHA) protein
MAGHAVLLKALTPEAKAALGGNYYGISQFPFRVGRESRTTIAESFFGSRRNNDSAPNNDLYLVETGALLNVSRDHFLVDADGENYVLVDRGSACGTLVEGELVGEKRKGGSRQLNNNDVIIVGTSESKYVFKFLIVENP